MENRTGTTALGMAQMTGSGQEKPMSGGNIDFEQVYRRYFRDIYAYVAYRVSGRAAAEDVTSQVFEKALDAWDGYDPERAAVSTWLFTIARNAVSDHFRRLARHGDAELNESAADPQSTDPEAELVNGERRRELSLAMAGLDAREQELLALKFGAALTNRHIAELMEISESNAGTILYRSLRKLKSKLEGGIDDD